MPSFVTFLRFFTVFAKEDKGTKSFYFTVHRFLEGIDMSNWKRLAILCQSIILNATKVKMCQREYYKKACKYVIIE